MLLTLTLALLTSLCALQGVSEGRPVITSVSASYKEINITASDNPLILAHSSFNVYVYRRRTDEDSLLEMVNTYLQGGQATVQVPLDPFIFYAVRIVEYFPRVSMEAENGSDKVQFKLNDTISVRDITATEMTVVFPKRASRDSVILGYSIAYTTEGLEDFVSKGRADSSRPQKMLTNLEEGAKYSITVEPRTHFRYRLEAGHTVQQTLQAAPSASPRNLTGFSLNSSAVQINWMPPPSRERNGEIISYEILWEDSGMLSLNTSGESDRTNWTYVVTGLDAGITYEIRVAARTMAGTGIYKSVRVRTNNSAPSASPRNLTGFSLNSSAVQINWMSPPSRERNGEIISYEIWWEDFGMLSLNTSGKSDRINWTYVVTGLNAGTTYDIWVAAHTMAGTGIYESVHVQTDPPESPPPVGETDDVFIFPVSIAVVVVVVIIVALVVSFTTAMIIVIEYKHLKLTTNPTQSDSPQEPSSSSPSNMTVYHKKDVKRFEKIGRGSFWKVHRGKLSDSCCAIKRLRGVKKGGDHKGLVSRVLRELDMWSSLNHPNIISLYGIYHEDDINIPLLIIELMDKNLTDQLNSTFDPTHRKSLFPLKTKLSVLSQVAGALDYLHCIKRVIHGDLTANNILLKENSPGSFTSKLTDFGMSRALNEQDNVMSTVQGTYSYMPPEVQNAGKTTTKVDIYSFGVLCVHVLSHRFPKPLHALTLDDLGVCVVVSEFSRYRPYLMELDDDEKLLEPLIEECLQYEPEDRLRPEEVIRQLNSIQGRLSMKETGPANPSHQPSVIHQQFSGPIVSGCTISGSVMNVGSFTNRNMQLVPVADTAPLSAPLEVIPEVSFGGNMPNTSTSLTAPSEVNPA